MVDLSSEEEPCATAALRIAVNAGGRVMGISKAGSGGIDPTLTQVRVACWCPGLLALLLDCLHNCMHLLALAGDGRGGAEAGPRHHPPARPLHCGKRSCCNELTRS